MKAIVAFAAVVMGGVGALLALTMMVLGAAAHATVLSPEPTPVALNEIPPAVLVMDLNAGQTCEDVPWQVLAAVEKDITGFTGPMVFPNVPAPDTTGLPVGSPRATKAGIVALAQFLCAGSPNGDLEAGLARINPDPVWVQGILEQAAAYAEMPEPEGDHEETLDGLAPGDVPIPDPTAPVTGLPTKPVPIEQTEAVGGGIRVHTSVADNVRAMIAAAKADGVILTGGAYRDPQQQIERRIANCGKSREAIYEWPSGRCNPPTARPGQSMHERGLAIDFNKCGTVDTACWKWLNANAAAYGFQNLTTKTKSGLPKEPWHWSTNGH